MLLRLMVAGPFVQLLRLFHCYSEVVEKPGIEFGKRPVIVPGAATGESKQTPPSILESGQEEHDSMVHRATIMSASFDTVIGHALS